MLIRKKVRSCLQRLQELLFFTPSGEFRFICRDVRVANCGYIAARLILLAHSGCALSFCEVLLGTYPKVIRLARRK